MKRYAVEVTDSALAAIRAQARYIAIEQGQPGNAQGWLNMVWDAVEDLETLPNARPFAEENDDVEYEVRFVLAGRESLLFTMDEEREIVWVIALRGQGRLPQPQELPQDISSLEIEREAPKRPVDDK